MAVSSNLGLLLKEKIKNSSSWKTHNNLVSNGFFKEKLNNTNQKDFIFISVGNLIKEKNFSLLLLSLIHISEPTRH